VSHESEGLSCEAAAAAADRLFRKTRGRALSAWSLLGVGLAMMVLTGQLPPDARRVPELVAVVLQMIGFGGGLVLSIYAHAAWGIRRICEARVSVPDLDAITAEHRRASLLAAVCGATAVASFALMWFADEHRWLGPIVGSLLIAGCAGVVHFLLVHDVTRRLEDLCKEKEMAAHPAEPTSSPDEA
jgi:hypothetical protein